MSMDPQLRNRVNALVGEGHSQQHVAKLLGVHPSTVSRILAERRAADGNHPMQDATDRFIDSLGTDLAPAIQARVANLRNLAAQLDWAAGAASGVAAAATAGLTKEYLALLGVLEDSTSFDDLTEALFRADED